MDSVLEEDVTLPGTRSGCSGLALGVPDDPEGISPDPGSGNGVLPNVSEEKVSPTRARNMKDFENQITELKKENFNLKLRIYFLEESLQRERGGRTERACKTNIELKVEVESLKRELQERERLLIKASKAVESLAGGGGSEVQWVKEDAQKKVRQVEDVLTKRIHLLEEDVKAAQAEMEKAFAGTESEKALRLSLESKLSEMKKMREGDLEMAAVLEGKDRLIEELKLSLKSKDALIQCLKEEKSQMASPDETVSSGELQGLSAALRGDGEGEAEAAQMEREKERSRFEERIQALREDLREKEREIATEKKNSLKRDKAIQGLTMALKAKEKEIEELNSEIEELSAAFAKAKEAPQKAQTQKFQGSEDYEAALLEKATLLAELHSENLSKSTENHRLRRSIKKVTQELSNLQQERERLEKALETARQERSKGDHTIHDLRNEVEKLRNEVNEREKAVENCYKSLLSESNKKLQSQEQVIRSLRESAAQKDLLLQKFNGRDLEAARQNCGLVPMEEPESGSEDLITEKCSSQSPGGKSIFSEEKQQLSYEELIQVVKKERDIYTRLVKSLQDSDSVSALQAELSSVFALRKRLEWDVLSYQHLRKALEEQISEIRRREEETFSFYSDQTSYLSICLEENNRLHVEHFSQEELKKKVSDLIQLVKELYADNQHLKKTIFDLSCVGFPGDNKPESVDQTETMEDSSKGGCKNGYLRHADSSILDYGGAHTSGGPGDQGLEEGELVSLLAPLFGEKAVWFLESRPDLLKVLRELLLEQMRLTEQEATGEHLDGKTEKMLRQVAVQLRGEFGHFIQASSSPMPPDELQWPRAVQLAQGAEASKAEQKDASVQTSAVEGDTLRCGHEGPREAWEEQLADAVFSAGRRPEEPCRMLGRQAPAPAFPRRTERDAKKSRLPVLIKPSQSLGGVCRLPASQEAVAHLQAQVLKLQGELKELKIRNKQLHQKLILAETMTEGRPAPEEVLPKAQNLVGTAYQDGPGKQGGLEATPRVWRDREGDEEQQAAHKPSQHSPPVPADQLLCAGHHLGVSYSEVYQPDDPGVLPPGDEDPSEDFPGPPSAATHLSSNSQFSTKVSVVGTNPLENTDTSNDKENLERKICDLETELEGYRSFILQLQKHSGFSEAIITVLCGTEGAQGGLSKSKGSADEEEMAFSSLRQVRYVKHMKILHPLAPKMMDGGALGSLGQQLVGQEYELQKEQNLNMELFGGIHNLRNKIRDLSPSRYDSLVQAQARELSLQRQQIKDSHSICVVYRRHVNTMIKAFEELLQASDVDLCVAEGFREQLHQCAALLGQLEQLFLKGNSAEVEMKTQREAREWAEEDGFTHQHVLPESPAPSACCVASDCGLSEKSCSSQDQKQDSEAEKASGLANNFSQDLLMEHIQEIRSLRRRLEESIKTNEKLRKQLERQGTECDQGSSNVLGYGPEVHNSLTSEVRFLRKQNQALNTMLAKGSRDKQKENEKLREALSRKAASLEHLQGELAAVQAEKERLQREADGKESENQRLLQEACHGRRALSRLQEESALRQQLLLQSDKLLRALRAELKVYEKLDQEQRRPREAGVEASREGWRGQDLLDHLHSLLAEVQALQALLEKSIKTNMTLQSWVEERLVQDGEKAREAALALALQSLSSPEQPLPLDEPDGDKCPVATDNSCDLFDPTPATPPRSASEMPALSGSDVDALSCDSGRSVVSASCASSLVPSHHLWASRSGRHVLGLAEDYDALCEQIGQGQTLLAEVDLQIREAPGPISQELVTKGPHAAPPSCSVTGVSSARRMLDEAARLLVRFWKVSLPTDGQCTLHCEQMGELKAEISKLHKKLFEQEKKLHNTLKLLQLSKNQEKVIFDQLVVTHEVLRKARGNLEAWECPPWNVQSQPTRLLRRTLSQ
ncbi:CDK5 regulatory subunit-associated protein 2 isoform X5 [Bubalus kerabau]|uniref:CDK5 regulatory subunit-associated protein 2 isoform X5 n=1 Tax=Bubalus carabanensis TaxID=3119969 RepID=UPI00244EBB66|nr:CDK5 regulatory subunit-associated protein 2 isoform X5 [Bubalus carabanensis]